MPNSAANYLQIHLHMVNILINMFRQPIVPMSCR